jgi:Na+-transporting methylmalonyl-CoA/oxaloacetate decarboxylase gamma subunit
MFGAVLVLIVLPLLIIAMSFIVFNFSGKRSKEEE